jgi:probable HAF family extracellular repeat protein
VSKGLSLLRFLLDAATLPKERNPTYAPTDKRLWFSEIPKERAECRSPFLSDALGEAPDFWLEVRKSRMPVRSPVPALIADWLRPEDLGDVYSRATGVSGDGTAVVGYSFDQGFVHEAFVWTAATGMVGLGSLPGALIADSLANAVSADGSTVVGLSLMRRGMVKHSCCGWNPIPPT